MNESAPDEAVAPLRRRSSWCVWLAGRALTPQGRTTAQDLVMQRWLALSTEERQARRNCARRREGLPVRDLAARPLLVAVNGGTVDVAVHDRYFRDTRRRMKARIRDAHPDRRRWTKVTVGKGGAVTPAAFISVPETSKPFLRARSAYDVWLRSQVAWYGAIGLSPPTRRDASAAAAGALQHTPPLALDATGTDGRK